MFFRQQFHSHIIDEQTFIFTSYLSLTIVQPLTKLQEDQLIKIISSHNYSTAKLQLDVQINENIDLETNKDKQNIFSQIDQNTQDLHPHPHTYLQIHQKYFFFSHHSLLSLSNIKNISTLLFHFTHLPHPPFIFLFHFISLSSILFRIQHRKLFHKNKLLQHTLISSPFSSHFKSMSNL